MEIPSGGDGSFKVAKPSGFSGVQFFLKPWLTMVTINFKTYPMVFPTNKKNYSQSHILMEQFLIGYNPDWKTFWKTKTKKPKQKTQQMFYKFDNFCIYIKEIFGKQDEDKTIEKQFLILKKTQSIMVYGSKSKILIYTIKWDDAAFASKFYEKLKNKVKDAIIAMDKPESLKNIIKIAVKIDDRQHNKFIDKKTWSKPIPKNKP